MASHRFARSSAPRLAGRARFAERLAGVLRAPWTQRTEASWSRAPWALLAAAAALVLLGWLAIGRSEELAGASGRYLARQTIWSAAAFLAMVLAAAPNYRRLARFSYAAFASSLVLLAAVYVFPPINGAQRWLRFGPVGLQPSEFAKPAFVLALARYLVYRDSYRRLAGLAIPLGLMFVPLLLVLKEPDLGTALLFPPVLFVMLYVAGARMRHLTLLVLAALLTTPVVWSQMSREQRSRITALVEQTGGGEAPTDDGYHLHQAKQMMALGGWRGSLVDGEPIADRSAYFVPEARTDSIASVVVERLGLAGLAATLGAVWSAGVARAAHRPSDARAIWATVGHRNMRAHGGAGDDQHRHDGRPRPDHRARPAAGELWRIEPRGQWRVPGAARECGASGRAMKLATIPFASPSSLRARR